MSKQVYKLKSDKADMRDRIYYAKSIKQSSNLPPKIDFRSKCSPIVDQGQLGSCTANAIASGLGEYLQNVKLNKVTPLSRLYLYWWERFVEGSVDEDSGAEIRDGMKILQQLGCSPELDCPYDINEFTKEPDAKAIIGGIDFKIAEYNRVKDLIGVKTVLAEKLPVVVGIQVYESFESDEAAKTGIIPMPNPNREQLLGGHAVLAVGYDDTKKQVIMRNSWGSQWGDEGYFYLPYEYFNYENGYVMDMWTGK
ncbi:C1 family peptidase [Clostridium sp. WILCCON 0269]|uniref:C1 family peptidase n=1 Tax=Candidatus Clostridium eludens TaxID=3381663 RepID=A0ABW8SEY0_9CLOT